MSGSQFAGYVAAPDSTLPIVGEYNDWKRLGIHPPITLLEKQDMTARVEAGALPTYLVRDSDLLRDGLQSKLAAITNRKPPQVEILLVTGESLAGKSRTAFEGIRKQCPDWRLLIPSNPSSLTQILSNSTIDLQKVVVWLDEMQGYLYNRECREQIERLLDWPIGPTIILATLTADAEAKLLNQDAVQRWYSRAGRVTLYRQPSKSELARAAEVSDPWIEETLLKIEGRYGIAEWLGAGPHIARTLDRARASSAAVQKLGVAIVDAATDCYRTGLLAPIREELLREASKLYLNGEDFVATEWQVALEWACSKVVGASAMLTRTERGFAVFSYLVAESSRIRSAPPGDLWEIVIRDLTPVSLHAVADMAAYYHQEPVLRELAKRGAKYTLYLYLRSEKQKEGLFGLVAEGFPEARWKLTHILYNDGDIAGLVRLANDKRPARTIEDSAPRAALARLLVEKGAYRTLIRRASHGDLDSLDYLKATLVDGAIIKYLAGSRSSRIGQGIDARLLAATRSSTPETEMGETRNELDRALILGRALEVLIDLVRQGDEDGASLALEVLSRARGDLADPQVDRAEEYGYVQPDESALGSPTTSAPVNDQLSEVSPRLVPRGDRYGNRWPYPSLWDSWRIDHRHPDPADRELIDRLYVRSDAEALRRIGEQGHEYAMARYILLLCEEGREAELARIADRGNCWAADCLAELLTVRGDLSALVTRAKLGDPYSARSAGVKPAVEMCIKSEDMWLSDRTGVAGSFYLILGSTYLSAPAHIVTLAPVLYISARIFIPVTLIFSRRRKYRDWRESVAEYFIGHSGPARTRVWPKLRESASRNRRLLRFVKLQV
jgi:hypothetical protein